MVSIPRATVLALVVLVAPWAAWAQSDLQGAWDGAIHVLGQDLEIRITLAFGGNEPKGSIDIPAQGAIGLPLANIKVNGETVRFDLPTPIGVAVFDGTRKGDVISGSFTQGAAKGTFDLKRAQKAAAPPEPPPPYRVEEVAIANGPNRIAGTLTIPPSPGRHPAVVLITGSGSQDRDETIFGFKVFGVIADYLTRQGIAVLRCDDRGVGGSTGKTAESTSEDFATDVLADIAYLKTRPDIDAKRIGLLGHSEGGLIAPMVAARSNDVRFIVLLSGPGLPGEKILLAQGELLLKARGAPADVLAKQAEVQRRLFDVSRGKLSVEDAMKLFTADIAEQTASVPEAQRASLTELARKQSEGQIESVQTPWFRFFLDYDPAPTLARVRCPILALFGALDLQVPAESNKQAMEQAFAASGHRDQTTKVMPKANHLYQEATTGDAIEYGKLKKEFVPDLLPTVATWIRARVGLS